MTSSADRPPMTHSTLQTPVTPAGPSLPRCEHVWIVQKTMDTGLAPGLLLAWRRNRRGQWEGWVFWGVPGIPAHGGEPFVQLGWLDADRIRRRQ